MIGALLRVRTKNARNEAINRDLVILQVLRRIENHCVRAAVDGQDTWSGEVELPLHTEYNRSDLGFIAKDLVEALQADSNLQAEVGYHLGDDFFRVFVSWQV